jgi:outer membrane lipase/esterase
MVAMPAHAGEVYAFGDSLLDDGTILRTTGSTADAATGSLYSGRNFSNGVTAFDYFGTLTGRGVDPSNDLAVAGVFSGLNSSSIGDYPGTLSQVDSFLTGGGRFSSGDIVLLDGGTNELATLTNPSYGLPNGLTAPVTTSQLVTYVGANFTSILSSLKGAGLKDVFLYNVPNASAASVAINAEIVTTAAAVSGRGLNVHVFDLLRLYEKVAANPTLYGFISGGGCSTSAACVADAASRENSYFTVDGLHPTTAGHDLIAQYLASQYFAPQVVMPEATLAEATAIVFSQSLLSRLDSTVQNPGTRGPSVPASIAPLLPDAFAPAALGPITGFVSASVAGGVAAGGSVGSGPGFSSFGYDLAGLTVGNEAQPTAQLRVGSAFSYLATDTGMRAFANNRITLNAMQGSIYGAFDGPQAFVDEVVTYGLDIIETSRAGVVSRLHGVAIGGTVSTETKAGYLVDWGAVRLGPIADLAYTHLRIAGYSETGDSLLTLRDGPQDQDLLTGAGGVQLRAGPTLASWLTGTLDLTADHAFFGNGRLLKTAQTYAPSVLIRTAADTPADTLFGRVSGTLHADFAAGFSGDLSGFTTFAQASGDAYGVDARLTYHY